MLKVIFLCLISLFAWSSGQKVPKKLRLVLILFISFEEEAFNDHSEKQIIPIN
jgi:hypothetical protein